MVKHILVTGASSGIGLALCKLLIRDHSCYVYLGSRNVAKGETAKKTILEEVPDKADMIEVVQIDVGNDNSVQAAAKSLRDRGIKLYALVNNAGMGGKADMTDVMMNTNYMGPKRVTDAFVGLIDPKEGRIVNTSSGAASGWVKRQDAKTQAFYTNPNLTWEDLNASVQANAAAKNFGQGFSSAYGLSKAALCALTLVQAKSFPNLKVTSLSPGFVDTPLAAGSNSTSKITPEKGCTSSLKCLFEDVISGAYYGSDGLRSPMTIGRDPGTPEFQGESNPDPAKYTRSNEKRVIKHILVTGASSGIGLALCKLLIRDHACYVYLGSRNVAKGETAKKTILEEVPDKSNMIEVVQIDVGNDFSVKAAANTLKDRGVKLYALVNNAGIAGSGADITDLMMNTNYEGPKRVTNAFAGLIDPKEGRVVNTSSGAASWWLSNQDANTKEVYTNPNISWEVLDAIIQADAAAKNFGKGFSSAYGLSKAALCALTIVQAKTFPNLKITSLSPGFVDTPLAAGVNSSSKITPEKGCTSALKCLFQDVVSGAYYGSDGLRSPMTIGRDPGMPEYQGEANPDPARYTKPNEKSVFDQMIKHILVTGASSGIGLALCKLLIRDHSCYVYLGSRNVAKGETAKKTILEEVPDKADMIEVIQIDVGNNDSVQAAAKSLRDRGVKLYALVNNAGMVGKADMTDVMMNTNYMGPKRVTDAFVGLIDPKEGRIVNTSSGVASGWVKRQDAKTQALYTNPDLTWEDLNAFVQANVAAKNLGPGFSSAYGLSKAALCALTLVQAKAFPNLKVTSLSPGLVDTPLVAGFNSTSKITPEKGCTSSLKCLFEDVISGAYYGSDGLRSPMTVGRDPGTPEYQGEANPDPAKYTR